MDTKNRKRKRWINKRIFRINGKNEIIKWRWNGKIEIYWRLKKIIKKNDVI